jgi:hypothetical protein
MNIKKFVIAGLLSGIVNWLGGWLFYGIIFSEILNSPNSDEMNMIFILLGCLTSGFLFSFIFLKWAGISTLQSGAKAGAILGLFLGLYGNFFQWANESTVNYTIFGVDLVISIVLGVMTGAVAGWVIGKLKD